MPATPGLRRIAMVAAGLLAAGIGARAALSLFIPAEAVRDEVKAQIRAMTGLDPVLNGPVDVSLFPTGSVGFTDVSLAGERAEQPALTVEQLRVRLRFFPLLAGTIEIADVTLVHPVIAVAFAADGSSNWSGHIDTLARALQPGSERSASFSEIKISDGAVILHDDSYRVVETLRDMEVSLAWPSISSSFAATGRFVWHDEPIDVALTLGDFLAALTGERSGLKLRLGAAPLKFAFDGNLGYRPTLKVEGTLAADTNSLRDTMRWVAAATAPGSGGFGRFALKAQTNVTGGNVSLSAVNIDLDGNLGEGALTYLGHDHRALQGTLAFETADLTPYLSTVRLLTGDDWNRRPISFADIDRADLDLRLSAASVKIAGTRLGRTAMSVNLRNGDLSVAVGEAQAFGGIVSGSFGLASAPAGASLKAQLQFSDVDLDQCLGELAGIRRIEGKGTLGFAVNSLGASVFELTQALNGTANLVSQGGVIAGINVEQLLKRLERNPLAGRADFRNGKTPFDTLSVSLKVTQGIARLEDLQIRGPAVRLTLGGSASIPARDLDLKGTASLLSASAPEAAASFDLPFLVRGPWSDPLIWPDAQALIRRSGAAAPLLDAVRNRLAREPSRPAPEATSSPAPTAPQ